MKTKIILYVLLLSVFVIAGNASAFTEGSSNNYFGSGAGGTGGNYNSFFGAYAGNVNTGNYNTFMGFGAGDPNSTGSSNTFIGFYSGIANTTGYSNTFIGGDAGHRNTLGISNTFIGGFAGFYNEEGNYNTFIGMNAGHENYSGSNNTFIGQDAGYENTTGISNTFIGDGAGYYNTNGIYNTYLGHLAGSSNTTGFNNTFLGYAAGHHNNKGIGNVFLGHYAGFNETGSNKLYIDSSSTATPLIYGEFDTRIVAVNGFLGVGTTMPEENLHVYSPDDEAILLAETDTGAGAGFRFLDNDVGGDWKAKITLLGDFKIRNHAGGYDLMYFTKTNNVGIGTNSPSQKLHVNGNVTADNYFYNSSREYKEQIEALSAEAAMSAMKELKPVTYKYRNNREESHVGFIAEEVPELVATKNRKNLSPMDIVAVLTKVAQEQQKTISALKEQNRELLEKVTKLEKEIKSKGTLASVMN